MWAQDWEYFFHGGGCELTHRETREPINWEGPDPAAFSFTSFIHHLEWRFSRSDQLPLLKSYVAQYSPLSILNLINALVQEGIITPERHLIPPSVQATAA
jgi:hypothetical protein